MYIDSLISPLLYGMIDAILPVISYNYGAKSYKRIAIFFRITCFTGFTISIVTMAIIFIFPDFLVNLFAPKSDTDIIKMGKSALLLGAPAYLFAWYTMTVGSFLTGLEKATASIVVMLADSVILPLVLMIVLSRMFGVYGIFIVPSISGLISIIIAFILWRRYAEEELKNK